jgi:hypothetical protein
MSKYGPATEKQIDYLITFMEDHLLRRKFTRAEAANMRQVLYTNIYTAQLERGGKLLAALKSRVDANNATPVSKLGESLMKLKAFCQAPPF